VIKVRLLIFAAAIFFSEGNLKIAEAAEAKIVWKAIGPGLEAADAQQWSVIDLPRGAKPRSFKFSALRFHLGYYEMRLVSIGDFARLKSVQIAQDQKLAKDLPALFELGVNAVFRTNPFNAPIVAVVPAGFAISSEKPTNLGLLKIDGIEKSRLLLKGPSAILCLDNAPSPRFQYQVPTFFRTRDTNKPEIDDCRDAVQVGPRIIEDPKSTAKNEFENDPDKYQIETYKQKIDGKVVDVPVYQGIPESAASATPYLRTVLAIDDPGRFGKTVTNKEVARNAYIVVTTTPATLWDLQDMLSSPAFYANERYAPHWAVNLPGDNYASMIRVRSVDDARQNQSEPIKVGATDQRQASVLVVTRRK